MGLRPLFGSRASVDNIHDSFGATVELVKSSESEQENPLDRPIDHNASSESQQDASQQSKQQHKNGHGLAGLLNGAALMSKKDSQSKAQDRHDGPTRYSGPSTASPTRRRC